MRNHTSDYSTRVCIAALLVCVAIAGSLSARPVYIGAKLGAVVSDQDYDYTNDEFTFNPRSSVAPVFGFFVEVSHNSILSSRFDLLYVRKGSEVKVLSNPTKPDAGDDDAIEVKDKIDYLTFSPKLKAAVPLGPGAPFVVAGPRVDYKIGSDFEMNALASDHLESTVLGMSIGAGYQIHLGGKHLLFAEVVYHHDFSDAYKLSRLNVRNRAVVITAGMSF